MYLSSRYTLVNFKLIWGSGMVGGGSCGYKFFSFSREGGGGEGSGF